MPPAEGGGMEIIMLDKVNKDISKQRKYMDWNNMLIHLEALYVLDNALTEPEDDG